MTTPVRVVPAPLVGAPARTLLIAGMTATVVALLVARLEAPLVLTAILLAAGLVALFLRPDWVTLGVAAAIYANLPVLVLRAGVPKPAAAAMVLLLGVPLLHHLIIRRERIRIDTTLLWMVGYLLVLLASAVGVRSAPDAVDYLVTFVAEGLVLFWLVTNVIRSAETLHRVIWAVMATGALIGALTLFQEVTGRFDVQLGGLVQRNNEFLSLRRRAENDPEALEAVQRYGAKNRSERPGGPVAEPNRFAQIMIVLLPLVVLQYRRATRRPVRLWAMGFGLLILIGIVFSDSRGAFLTLMGVCFLMSRLGWIKPRNLMIAGALGVMLVPVVAPRYVQRVMSIATAANVGGSDSSTEVDGAIRGRLTEMLAAFQAFRDHPLLGVGPGQYRPVYSLIYHQTDPRLKFRDLKIARSAHSLYIEIAAETGILGLTVFFGMIVHLLRTLMQAARRVRSSSPEAADLAYAFALSLVAYLGTAAFLHLSYMRYYWFLLALASCAQYFVARTPRPRAAVVWPRMPLPAAAAA